MSWVNTNAETNGSDKDGRIEKISKKLGVIPELKRRNVSSGRRPQPEAVYHDKTHRNHQQQKDSTQCR